MTQTGATGPAKVSLTKSAPAVSLAKHDPAGGGGGRITINLNWDAGGGGQQGGGGGLRALFRRKDPTIDLDLGCLYELASGKKSAVQALGDSFGSFDGPPYIKLDKDDRSGTASDGENLFLNQAHAADIKRILIYAFIYEGAASWAAAKPVVTVRQQGGPAVEVVLDETDPQKTMCAVALIENTGGGDLQVSRQVRYFEGHEDMDKAFAWGLNWVAGSKD